VSLAARNSPAARTVLVALVAAALLAVAALPFAARGDEGATADHLVISEVATGGVSASDELIEIYNPTTAALPLEGLELVYVSASGATISRRAAWELGAPLVPPAHHVLVANELGSYAPIADALYASGMAATGGSVALRIQGGASAIDAIGWGTAASPWMEGMPAPAPAAGASLERLPGGALGSTRDTGDNLADFVVRSDPDPQNSGSPPAPDPSATPMPSTAPTASPLPTAAQSPAPSAAPTPGAAVIPIATARGVPDGTRVVVEGVATSGSAFTEGGGYVADASGAIAVLVSGGTFDRGERLRLTGSVDDRFSQRTLRVDAVDVVHLGSGSEPAPVSAPTGGIGEALEARLVAVSGAIQGSPSTLTGGLAFDLDDGSGPVRLLVGTVTAIDVTAWTSGTVVEVVGIVGQRDSSGTGTTGYRVQPRDTADVLHVGVPPSQEPSASPGPSATASPGAPGVIDIAAARALPKNERVRVRGTVTLPPGIVDAGTAAIQDATGAILLRLGDEVGPLERGDLVEVDGTRSTLAGMETLRVTVPARRIGTGPAPGARSLRTGEAGEAHEATLVSVRGALVGAARRASSGTVTFEIDDGSGPLRVSIGSALGVESTALGAGTWVEVRGVLGQETTGALPLRGYRVWPVMAADVAVLATGPAGGGPAGSNGSGAATGPAGALDALGAGGDPGLLIGATVVSGPWAELEVGGLLWDGSQLVAIERASADRLSAVLAGARPPMAVELIGLRATGRHAPLDVSTARLGDAADAIQRGSAAPAPPASAMPADGDDARWVSLVGRLQGRFPDLRLRLADATVRVDVQCAAAEVGATAGLVGVTGVGLAEPARVIVPCGGIVVAPALARSTGSAAHPVGAPPAAADDAARAEPAGLPVAAGVLVGLAAAALLAGIVVARRQAGPAPDGSDSADETDDPLPEPSAADATAPVLTLVPLPRERAP
jgi:uncharacterized protein YdeI (BOF family)